LGGLESSFCQGAAAAAGSGSVGLPRFPVPPVEGRRPIRRPQYPAQPFLSLSGSGHTQLLLLCWIESSIMPSSSSSSSNLISAATAEAAAASASASTARHPPPPPAKASAKANAPSASSSPALPRKIKKKKGAANDAMDAKPPAAKKRRVSSVDGGPGSGKGTEEEEEASGGSRRTKKPRTRGTSSSSSSGTAPPRPPDPNKLSSSKRLVLLLSDDDGTTTHLLRRHELPPTLQPWHDRVAGHLWSRAVALTLRSHPVSYRLPDDNPTSAASDAAAVVPHRRALESVLDLDSCEREDWRLRLMWGVGLLCRCDDHDHGTFDDPSPHLQRSTFDVLWRSVGERLRHRLDPMQRSEEDSISSRSAAISAAASRPQGSRANNDSTGAAAAPTAPSSAKRKKSSRLMTAQELADEIARQFDASHQAIPPGQALFSPW
jgi:hypothetical protein